MLMIVAGMIGGTGLMCVIFRRTLLGLIIGMQLMILGATMMFVLAGIFAAGSSDVASAARVNGHIGGIFIALGGIAQLVAGYALAVRLFYLKNRIEMSDLKTLKH